MSSIANRKYTDMRQIEFQQNGSSRVTAMLTQPLLENSSTYMCEIMHNGARAGVSKRRVDVFHHEAAERNSPDCHGTTQ